VNDEYRLDLGRYFDGELPEAERERVERQLTADPAAMRYVEQLRLLRRLADRHDPSSGSRSAGPIDVRPWQRAAAWRPHAWRVSAAAAAAAAIIGLVWYANSPRKLQHTTPKVSSASANVEKSSKPIEPSGSGSAAPGAAPHVAPPSLELDAQRFAWANGELTSPSAAARVVLDARPRHGSRSSNVEILAIELAHAPPHTMHQVARMVVARSVSIRQPPQPPRAGHKAPSATPNSPQGWLLERGQQSRAPIASAQMYHSPSMNLRTSESDHSATVLNDRGYGSQTHQVSSGSLRPGVIL
jgi:anti-sigma factor RsiW